MHIAAIVVCVAVLLRDALGGAWGLAHLSSGSIALATWGSQALIWLIAHVWCAAAGRTLDRTGRVSAYLAALRVGARARTLSAAACVAAVVALGWLDVVRRLIGDIVLIDEALAVLPAVACWIALWWSQAALERRIHEAGVVRALDEGRPVEIGATRWGIVAMHVRHELVITLVPMALILAWSEATGWALHALARWGSRAMLRGGDLAPGAELIETWVWQTRRWLFNASTDGTLSRVWLALAAIGVALVFVFMPLILRVAWSTARLGTGELRDRLLAMCAAQRVRVRDILVWRTHSTMVNGAVAGIVGRFRYILLTDALLQRMPTDRVEAVMAHEIAHVRRGHVAWMAAALIVTAWGTGRLMESSLAAAGFHSPVAGRNVAARDADALAAGAAAFVSLGAGLVVVGWVSRTFERQADAFAAQHLSGLRPGPDRVTRTHSLKDSPLIAPEAVDAMVGALRAVCELNHIRPEKFTWRHGSIRSRIDHLSGLVGLPADRLPIDARARWIKRAVAAAAVGLVIVELWGERG